MRSTEQMVSTDSGRSGSKPVVAAIVTSKRGVLIGRRHDGRPPWTFIAGEIEPGESPADAAVREVREETGLLVAAGQEIGHRVHPGTGRTMIYVAAWPARGADIVVGDRDDLAEVRWTSLAEAEALMDPDGMFGPVREYLVDTMHACAELGNAAALMPVVAAWQSTAETYSDPEPPEAAARSLDGTGHGEVPDS